MPFENYAVNAASPVEFSLSADIYTKSEVDAIIEGLKSKIYKLLCDINIDISEEDFYEALRL